eukprot:CCRYP_014942-RA/>CCRYP_014942-RA protein AED:0.31 eAED:0.05 QI:0/-1/0/1/-1/1/1/0/215
MNSPNSILGLIFSPCTNLQASRPHPALRPAFIPTHTSIRRAPNDVTCRQQCLHSFHHLHLSKYTSLDQLQDDDLVALPFDASASPPTTQTSESPALRLCVIRNQQFVYPLVRHEDDVETDLFLDPKHVESTLRLQDFEPSGNVEGQSSIPYYGVGWYGQRPVPSLGGGPGHGADATEIWTMEEEMLEKCLEDGVHVPVIDVGIAHGEKARGGALF